LDAAQALQFGSAWGLNLALAALLGIVAARHWLADGAAFDTDAAAVCMRLDAAWRPAALACLGGQFAALWSAAATMAGVAPAAAGPALWTMLTATAFGKAGLLGLSCAAILAAAGPVLLRGRAAVMSRAGQAARVGSLAAGGVTAPDVAAPWRDIAATDGAGRGGGNSDGGASAPNAAAWRAAALGLLAAFAAARAANSHAAENGLLSMGMLIEWLHLVLVCLWLGGVAVAAWLVMPRRGAAPVRFMRCLSGAATLAIAGILATGAYNAWHGLGTPQNALGNPYGTALLVKIGLVLLAAAMGGYNKLSAFPRAEAGNTGALRRARTVLQLETVVLVAAMLAAAVLVAQQPPAMA